MKANTALAFFCAGLALLLLHRRAPGSPSQSVWTIRLSSALAAICFLIGLVTTIQYLTGRNFGIDELLFRETSQAINTVEPGRMALSSAICFILTGLSILPHTLNKPRLAQQSLILVTPVPMLALLSIVGYLCSSGILYTLGPFTSMALHTGFSFLFLSIAIFLLHKTHPLYLLLSDKGPGGTYTRWLLPTAIFLPLLMAKLHLYGEDHGWFGLEQGEAIESCLTIIILLLIILTQGTQLMRTDKLRKQTDSVLQAYQNKLREANTDLEIRVAQRTAELCYLNDQLEEVGRVARVGGWELDTRSMKVTWSPIVAEIHEVTAFTQTSVENGISYYAPEHQAIINTAVQKACTEGTAFDLELQILTAKGRRCWVRALGRGYWNEGAIHRVAGVFQDIDSQKRAQLQQENQQYQDAHQREEFLNQRFSIFMEHIPAAVFIYEASGKLLYSNPCFQNTFLPPLATGQMLNPQELPCPSVSEREALLRRLFSGADTSDECVKLETGETRFFEVRRFPLQAFSGQPVNGGVAVDVTERKELETRQRRQESQQRQQQKLEALGVMASGVAHEINNPINGIINYAQLIVDKSPGQSVQHFYATEIIAESQRVANIVRNLLQFARQEKQVPCAWTIQEIIEETLLLIRSILKKEQIVLRLQLAPELPRVICCKQQIQQVILNLITNSRDALTEARCYAPEKRIELSGALSNDLVKPMLQLSIADNGGGIAPEILPNIFDPFFTTKSLDKGTGLGLSISHGIMKEHGGDLTVDNSPSVGCTFHLSLPIEHLSAKGLDTPVGNSP